MKKEKSINAKTEIFKQKILELINSSQLPISNIYYVFQLIEKQLEKTYYGIINSELLEQPGEQEKINLEEQNENKEQ